MPRPIIILGVERSGTSLLAEMVQTWGAYLGQPDELGEPDESNPHGRFEYEPLWKLLARVGEFESGRSWWDSTFDDIVRAKADDPAIARDANELTAAMENADRPWAWKDPALAHFLSFWEPFWNDPVFVIVVRNPADIAHSWQKFAQASGRRPTSIECNLIRWQDITLKILRGTEYTNAKLFVEFEKVVAAPTSQAKRLAAFLDANLGTPAAATAADRMARACDTTLWRNRERSGAKGDPLTEPQRALYSFQQQRGADAVLPFVDDYEMPANWRRFVIAEESAQ